ncbi:hypothetical protein LAUMK4_02446 [Mycobacterium persicum]|uniref:Uncharacterized protein n=1 Tax=Mycobacterium persicum TaxID=1487726 RepID=A0ABY6RI13_9MYCO|nr:hypothetical protein LAUMK15_02773 [Mycobacterium persicum]VAZ93409.1 hypothetical protein LAUMK4_02446 [Mycobacterium persicum]
MDALSIETQPGDDKLTLAQWMTVLAMGLGFAVTGADQPSCPRAWASSSHRRPAS